MKSHTWINYMLLLLNVTMLTIGQILFKVGLQKIGGVNLTNAWKALFVPSVTVAITLYALSTLVWLTILSRMPLSVAYPMQSIAYIFSMIAAAIFFHEPVSIVKWIGGVVIMVGVILISL